MALLSKFSTPAGRPEPTVADANAWSARVQGIFARYADEFPQFYDPMSTDTPTDAQAASVVWAAFPSSLLRTTTSDEERWRKADSQRKFQDEYCEWSVERDADENIRRVTFTSEVPEFWEHVASRDRNRLLLLYRELVSPEVELDDLFDANGRYKRDNRWNNSTKGRLAHLSQGANTLGAAVGLAASSTILRRDKDGEPVKDQQLLVRCAELGSPFRDSDPQIASVVNSIVATGAEITLQDPVGLYIQGIRTAGMTTPDNEDPAKFWTIERGDAAHTLRASFHVPEERRYTVSHIEINGRPIRFGAQLADRVQVRITAIAKAGNHAVERQPCLISI